VDGVWWRDFTEASANTTAAKISLIMRRLPVSVLGERFPDLDPKELNKVGKILREECAP
jgi:hypothetical protein